MMLSVALLSELDGLSKDRKHARRILGLGYRETQDEHIWQVLLHPADWICVAGKIEGAGDARSVS